jgi:tRNA pseudouridine55 synthase
MLNGFLNVRKPGGMTSNDVVEQVRRILSMNLGHAGTLDPMAEGVLVLGLGAARKFIAWLESGKEYEAVMRLGAETDTLDVEGRITQERPVECTPEAVREAVEGLTGDPVLPVPAYSAVHSGGRRLYEIARSGDPVPAMTRTMRVYSITVTNIVLPRVEFRISCAAGTYVRAVSAEWGRRLGCGAVLETLVRTRSGAFGIADSLSLERVRELAESAGVSPVPIGRALAHLPGSVFPPASAARLMQGQTVPAPAGFSAPEGAAVRLAGEDGEFLGIGAVCAGGEHGIVLRPVRMLPADLGSRP